MNGRIEYKRVKSHAMEKNRLAAVRARGQSMWLDYLSRDLIESGDLERWVGRGVTGVTSNPAIFEKAISGSDTYDNDIFSLAKSGLGAEAVYRDLVLNDVMAAADILFPVYEESGGGDGFVSVEVSPRLARDTDATIDEARDLWQSLGRENIMIKVPATGEGLPAVTRLIAEGINVNVTLLFGLPRYLKVAEAWLAGLESLREAGKDLHRTASVASFFLSRIDTLVDPLLERCAVPEAGDARGETAIACARLAYRNFGSIARSARFQELRGHGARPQRLLWASTGSKNPAYADTHYVEPLIGPDTVNTLPPATLSAFLERGAIAPGLTQDVDQAERLIQNLPDWGIDLDAVTAQLEEEGIGKFVDAHDRLLRAIGQKLSSVKFAGGGKATFPANAGL